MRASLRAARAWYLKEAGQRSVRRSTLRDAAAYLPRGFYRVRHKLAYNRQAHPDRDLVRLRASRSAPPRPYRQILSLLLRITSPSLLRIGSLGSRRSRSTDARIILFTASSNIVILAPDEGWVRRIAYRPTVSADSSRSSIRSRGPGPLRRAPGTFDDDYCASRTALSMFLPGSSFRVEEGGAVLVEHYARGQMLASIDPAEQLAVTRALLDRLVLLAQDGSMRRGRRDLVGSIAADLRSAEGGTDERAVQDLAHRLGGCVDVLSHGDLTVQNVMVDIDGMQVIDWDATSLGIRPAWFDALHLLLGNKSSAAVRSAALCGEFEAELSRLWNACDVPGLSSPLTADSMLVVRQLMATRPSRRLKLDRHTG